MNTSDSKYTLDLSEEDYQKATVEVAFLLDAFASTIDNIMGGNTAPVGRIAGRDTASKLPVNISDPTLQSIIHELQKLMHSGFDFTLDDSGLRFKGCIIRDMCNLRKIETGGALCRLFHSYFDGIVNGLLYRPVKSAIISTGDECRIQTAIQ
ncbi:MAG: hypothetical protein PHN84_14685 [Desulfuromonadaceae bacterium]|nr:hypothetical protein [Desulfuromonadaceae bacterium]MDD2854649.1 hypothetical protein [Desulfuromonadaceae bacterium]